MKAKLKKDSGGAYTLVLDSPYEYPSPLPFLSLKNCQAIERGYDLDELANELLYSKYPLHPSNDSGYWLDMYKEGFQKALELIGDKKFSEKDIYEAFSLGERGDRFELGDLLDSRQKTEWYVEIEMRSKDIDELRESGEGFLNNKNLYVPELDADGCLILRLITE